MTQRIDFYHHVRDPLAFACKLAATVMCKGQRLLVLLADPAQLHASDERLWTWQPTSFIPHCRLDEPIAAATPVLLATRLPPGPAPCPVLLNLSLGVPDEYSRFERLLEIVGEDPDSLARARQVARAYKAAGLETVYHDMTGR